MFKQILDPANNLFITWLIALIPVVALLFMLAALRWSAWIATLIGSLITLALGLWVWRMPFDDGIRAYIYGSATGVWNVDWITFWGVMLFNTLVVTGTFDKLRRWLIAQGIAAPDKLAIVGWSYGGYAALQSGVVAPDLFKAIVAVAPVTDLDELKKQYLRTTAQREIRDFVGSGPHIREGSPAQNAAAIKAPVMLFHGDLDVNVRVVESQLMADKLRSAGKKVDLTIYPKLDHQLDDAAARADMLGKSDAFLRASMGIR